MAETKPWAILLVVVCTLFTSLGALFLKKGMAVFAFSLQGMINAYLVFVGLLFYFLGFVLLTISFRHGELSVLFPFVSLSFVWVTILSYFYLKEMVSLVEIMGVAAIVLGVAFIGISSNNKKKLRLRA
jgi:drug/metabolite transporter (DMT)-like permease